ncbi:hypothetical protein [Listeria booriae]|uniref:Uncharacterized protein n=1 Tax=Listeria booriae TaxID=1552123 RepID=A0A7X1CBL6_9LIST|nr:hypothetical protein [Listeria booriae]MBC1491522.1 hypothetical protein [Listeria booriae]
MKKWLAIGIALSFILNGCSTEKTRKLKIKPSRSCSGKPEIQQISNKPSCIGKRFTKTQRKNSILTIKLLY